MKLFCLILIGFGVGVMAGFIPYVMTMQNNHEGRVL